VAVLKCWNQPDRCTRLTAKIPASHKVGRPVREITWQWEGQMLWLAGEALLDPRPTYAGSINLPVIPT